ncbi:MAG: OmpA family protein [Myxococcota bacterium]
MRVHALWMAAVLTSGCVAKNKYTALQAELDVVKTELTGKLQAETGRATSLEGAVKAEQAKVAELEQRIADLERKYTEALSDKSKLDASVTEMQAALRDLEARRVAAEARVAEYRDLLAKFKTLIDAGKLKVKIVNGRMVVELASDILFASGSAGLSPEGEAALTDVAKVLASLSDRSFQIEGHTDNVPIKTERFPSNWELGAARAITVVQTLEKGGVPAARLSAASYSEYRPVLPNDSTEGKTGNRRIEIVLVPDLSQLPGYDELSKLSN